MSDEDRIRAAIPKARAVAARVGPLHAAWDVIFDAEALLAGRPTILEGTREEVARKLADSLERY